jgi:hypothetical protein
LIWTQSKLLLHSSPSSGSAALVEITAAAAVLLLVGVVRAKVGLRLFSNC